MLTVVLFILGFLTVGIIGGFILGAMASKESEMVRLSLIALFGVFALYSTINLLYSLIVSEITSSLLFGIPFGNSPVFPIILVLIGIGSLIGLTTSYYLR